MKNLIVASIITATAIISLGAGAQAAIPINPVQTQATTAAVTDVAYVVRHGPNGTYYRGTNRGYYAGPNCYMKRVTHYHNGRAVVDHVRVCR